MKSIRKPFTHKLQIINVAVKGLQNTKFYIMILVLAILAGFFGLSPAISLLMTSIIIRNSGTIAIISPLHVEGRYIKDSFGSTVYLRGVNKVGFEDQPGGIWMGRAVEDYSQWNPDDVRTELDAMESWGINTIRCHHAVEHWKYDMGQHRQIIKEFLTLAAEKGMYVIYDGYSVRNYWNGAAQDPLPYPPYQKSENASDVIASEEEFIEWCVSVASELKDYPNIIFELWNEPCGDEQAKQSWFNVSQRCINAIRGAGATQLIIFQWQVDCWINLDYPPPSNAASTMDWVLEANLTDPLENLVYSTHMYRVGGSFHHSEPEKWNAWEYDEIKLAFQYMKLDWVVETFNKPLIVGEIGADLAYTGEELERELIAFNNCLTIFKEWGIHYAAFWWRDIGIFRLLKYGEPWVPPPTESGQILINALKSQE